MVHIFTLTWKSSSRGSMIILLQCRACIGDEWPGFITNVGSDVS